MYDKQPYIPVSSSSDRCRVGWEAIGMSLREVPGEARRVVCVECYPGVFVREVRDRLKALPEPSLVISTEDLLLPPGELDRRFDPILTHDPVFGMMTGIEIDEYLDKEKLRQAQQEVAKTNAGTALVVGPGATLVARHYDIWSTQTWPGGKSSSVSGAVRSGTSAQTTWMSGRRRDTSVPSFSTGVPRTGSRSACWPVSITCSTPIPPRLQR